MSDLLVRNVPEEVIAALDAHAGALGLSRNEYLRRRLGQEADRQDSPVTINDLVQFGVTFADLGNDEVMGKAWE